MDADVDTTIAVIFEECKFIFQPYSDGLYYHDATITSEPVTN